MSILLTCCMYIYHLCAWVLYRPEENIRTSYHVSHRVGSGKRSRAATHPDCGAISPASHAEF